MFQQQNPSEPPAVMAWKICGKLIELVDFSGEDLRFLRFCSGIEEVLGTLGTWLWVRCCEKSC